MKMFDTNLATQASTFLGVTTITTSGEPITASGDSIVSGTWVDLAVEIATIKTALTDVQTKLELLVSSIIPTVVTPTPLVTPDVVMTGTN